MTHDYDDWDAPEQLEYEPKTPKEEREALGHAPLATLRATPATEQATALMHDLASRYSRPQSSKGRTYARGKTLERYANAAGAFIADLLIAAANKRSEGWLRCSLDKTAYSGQYVTWTMFDNVRKAWLEAALIEHKPGYPRMLAFGNPGPAHGKLTRYRATPRLIEIGAEHGITPANVLDHFKIEFKMPSELIWLTQPSEPTPDTQRVAELRGDVEELNAFFAKQTLTPSTIKHLGWIRMFHGYTKGYRWNNGGRLYSQPQGALCYQSLPETKPDDRQITRSQIRINGELGVEIDISSSFLTIFYALCDEQLDPTQDAYAGILGSTALDRHVAKFWINASFGNKGLLTKWSKDSLKSIEKQLKDKQLSGFDKKRYPMKMIKEKVLERHPLLARWGGEIRGRVRNYGDLMYRESEAIIGAMLILMRDHQVPSLPVHDSIIVPESRFTVAKRILADQFRKVTGVVPKLEPEDAPWDF